MGGRASLVAIAYAGSELAERALGALRDLGDDHVLAIHDAAIVVKSDDGHLALRQTREVAAGEAAVGGGAIGLLVGLALVVPVAGALVGIAAGAGFAALDRGIPNDEMRRLGATLEPGHAVLFALIGEVDWAALRERLDTYGGELVTSEVEDDVVAAFAALPQ